MAGKFLFDSFILVLYLIYNYLSLHAGVSTVDHQFRPSAIPTSAFADAVKEYKGDSGTDDEGEWRTA